MTCSPLCSAFQFSELNIYWPPINPENTRFVLAVNLLGLIFNAAFQHLCINHSTVSFFKWGAPDSVLTADLHWSQTGVIKHPVTQTERETEFFRFPRKSFEVYCDHCYWSHNTSNFHCQFYVIKRKWVILAYFWHISKKLILILKEIPSYQPEELTGEFRGNFHWYLSSGNMCWKKCRTVVSAQ